MDGRSKKRKAVPSLHIHRPTVSHTLSISDDQRRVRTRINRIGSSSATPSDTEYPADPRTEAAFNDFANFSYNLGDEIPGEDEQNLLEEDDGIFVTKPRRYRSSDHPLENWLPHKDVYLEELLRLEGRAGSDGACASCRAPVANVWCRDQECSGGGIFCRSCMVERHRSLPLHWVEVWNGTFFERSTLRSLGLRVQLGHGGSGCPFKTAAHKDFFVIHSNGIHSVGLDFCGCDPQISQARQLLRSSWWPATPLQPQTCATFSVLRLFHLANCLGKVPAFNFYRALVLQTDNVGLNSPPDRRSSFMRIVRQWRFLKMMKRAGRGHDATGIDGTAEGELAVQCPACPHPGKNLSDDWRTAPDHLRFLYTLFLAQDANFRLRNRDRSNDERDPTLGQGLAYFVNKGPYVEFLKDFVNQEDISTCSGFAAMFLANTRYTKGLRTTGVGGVACGRHSLWRPNGIGDLQKGERYCNMDYLFLSAVKGADLSALVVSYDIACQWGKNLWRRMEEFPEDLRLSISPECCKLKVPNFHLPPHKVQCHSPYSFHFLPGAGRTHGETIEENWADSNAAASQTKEMGPGSRQDTLDDIFGFHNWMRITVFGRVMQKRLLEATKEERVHREILEAFTTGLNTYRPGAVDAWQREIALWERDHDQPCPYDVREQPHVTLKDVQLQIAQEEYERTRTQSGATITHETSPASFIIMGLGIEDSQRSLKIDIKARTSHTTLQETDIQKRRTALLKRIQEFRSLQAVYMPRLEHYLPEDQRRAITDAGGAHPEALRLFLPSELPDDATRILACEATLPNLEGRLRHAQAADSLEDVRRGLRSRTVTNKFKIRNITGQQANTRAQAVQRQIDIGIHLAKIRYRYARNALLRLLGHGDWERELCVLKDEDVRGLNERALTAEEHANQERLRELGSTILEPGGIAAEGTVGLGEGRRELSWIWYRVGKAADDDGGINEALRVEWCKAKARAERWREEVLLLDEEMRRIIAFGAWKAARWDAVGHACEGSNPAVTEGLRAYAAEHASMERGLAEQYCCMWAPLRVRAIAGLEGRSIDGTIEVELDPEYDADDEDE